MSKVAVGEGWETTQHQAYQKADETNVSQDSALWEPEGPAAPTKGRQHPCCQAVKWR